MLGVDVAQARVEFTQDEIARFRNDQVSLPPPVVTIREVAAPYPNDALFDLISDHLSDLGTLLVGNMLYLWQSNAEKRRLEIHAAKALRHCVDSIVSISAHHGLEAVANGGAIFSGISDDKVKTSIVESGGVTPDMELADECVLLVHPSARALDAQVSLMNELVAGENGVPMFTHHNLSLSEKNAAKQEEKEKGFFDAFVRQETGITFAHALPKHVEATDKYCAAITRSIVVGKIHNEVLHQLCGRFNRPPLLVDGSRVRRAATQILHLVSTWGENILALCSLSAPGPITFEALPAHIRDKITSITCDAFIKNLSVKLAIADGVGSEKNALVPGQVLDRFLTLVNDKEARAEYMERGDQDGQPGVYWRAVHEWSLNESGVDDDRDDDEESEEGCD